MAKPFRCAVAAVVLPIVLVGSPAQSAPLCTRYSSTPTGTKIDLLADPMPTFETGHVLPSPGAFAVTLKAAKNVVYPYKSPNSLDAGRGAVIAIEYIPAGEFRIDLSAHTQLDVIQESIVQPTKELPLNHACLGIDRSISVHTQAGPIILQFSGANVELLKVLMITSLPTNDAGTPNSISSVADP